MFGALLGFGSDEFELFSTTLISDCDDFTFTAEHASGPTVTVSPGGEYVEPDLGQGWFTCCEATATIGTIDEIEADRVVCELVNNQLACTDPVRIVFTRDFIRGGWRGPMEGIGANTYFQGLYVLPCRDNAGGDCDSCDKCEAFWDTQDDFVRYSERCVRVAPYYESKPCVQKPLCRPPAGDYERFLEDENGVKFYSTILTVF